MKRTRRYIQILKINISTLLIFEVLYKLFGYFLFIPFMGKLFNMIVKMRGYSYVCAENMKQVLFHPLTIIAMIVMLSLLAFYFMTDVSAIIYLMDKSYQKKKASLKKTLLFSLQNSIRIFQWNNWAMIPVILFMAPFLNLGVAISYYNSILLPSSVADFFLQHKIVILLVLIGILIICIFMVRWMYAFHYFTLEDIPFSKSRKKSITLAHRVRILDFIIISFVQIICYVSFEILTKIGIFLIVLLINNVSKYQIVTVAAMSAVWMVIGFFVTIYVALAVPVGYVIISLLFYYHIYQKGMELPHITQRGNVVRRTYWKNKWKVRGGLFAIICCAAIIYSGFLSSGKINFHVENFQTMEVTAHRGASDKAPENTLSAFEKASDLGADWIELDVQQLKDGTLIVLHDSDVRRTTNGKGKVWNLTIEDIEALDAGSWFNKEYKGEKIPTLEEVIEFAAWKQLRLNIEIKPTGHENEIEQSVVQLIEKMHFEDRCVVSSQEYHTLEKVKSCNPNIQTVYVMSIAYGNLNQFTDADIFSIDESNITSAMVKRIHKEGKQIYAWTVNNSNDMKKMIRYGVDNIITDKIHLAQNTIYKNKSSTRLEEYVRFLEKFQRIH